MFIRSLCVIVLFLGIECNVLSSDNENAIGTIQQISKDDITAAKYTIFLNAVASQADPHALYDPITESDRSLASIRRTQLSSRYFYEVIAGRENIPVSYITLNNGMRFCNWLENGAPENIDLNISDALLASITEKGSYEFHKEGDQEIGTLLPGAHYYLLNNDEWIQSGDRQSDSTPINSVNNTDLTHQPEQVKGPADTSLAIPDLQQIAPADQSLKSWADIIATILLVLMNVMLIFLQLICYSCFPEWSGLAWLNLHDGLEVTLHDGLEVTSMFDLWNPSTWFDGWNLRRWLNYFNPCEWFEDFMEKFIIIPLAKYVLPLIVLLLDSLNILTTKN